MNEWMNGEGRPLEGKEGGNHQISSSYHHIIQRWKKETRWLVASVCPVLPLSTYSIRYSSTVCSLPPPSRLHGRSSYAMTVEYKVESDQSFWSVLLWLHVWVLVDSYVYQDRRTGVVRCFFASLLPSLADEHQLTRFHEYTTRHGTLDVIMPTWMGASDLGKLRWNREHPQCRN